MRPGNFGRAVPGRRVLFVSSEIFPLAKTGGLADVCGALPPALAHAGTDICLMLPGYPEALDMAVGKRDVMALPDLAEDARLVVGMTPDTGLPLLLLDSPSLFGRTGGLYQDAQGRDWPDNHWRYAAFCHAAARVASGATPLAWRPDIVHANDWHTGLLPALLRDQAGGAPRTVFTIHNLAYQGNFPLDILDGLRLPRDAVPLASIEFYGQVSFLKAGIAYSDRLTTVSPNYAKEILTPEHGCGLDGLLRQRAKDLVGILNGVDYAVWDPRTDSALAARYCADCLAGKAACKLALQEELGLDRRPEAPLVIFANRLTHQKMADVLIGALPALVAQGVQLAIHGRGDKGFEEKFSEIAAQHAGRIAVRIGYEEALAHRLHAAADLALTPARFEPCGLTTMYAMRYGALPVARPVGGIVDTVVHFDGEDEAASGFLFAGEDPADIGACLDHAGRAYRDQDTWRRLQQQAMTQDFGWERAASRYSSLYESLMPAVEAENFIAAAE